MSGWPARRRRCGPTRRGQSRRGRPPSARRARSARAAVPGLRCCRRLVGVLLAKLGGDPIPDGRDPGLAVRPVIDGAIVPGPAALDRAGFNGAGCPTRCPQALYRQSGPREIRGAAGLFLMGDPGLEPGTSSLSGTPGGHAYPPLSRRKPLNTPQISSICSVAPKTPRTPMDNETQRNVGGNVGRCQRSIHVPLLRCMESSTDGRAAAFPQTQQWRRPAFGRAVA
jgi:hypothetical protein